MIYAIDFPLYYQFERNEAHHIQGASKNLVIFLEAPEQILTGLAVIICRLLKTAVFRSPLYALLCGP
jgi:hypothetical protein